MNSICCPTNDDDKIAKFPELGKPSNFRIHLGKRVWRCLKGRSWWNMLKLLNWLRLSKRIVQDACLFASQPDLVFVQAFGL